MSDVRIIVPDDLKAEVRAVLQQQDMNISQAVRLFFREIINHNGLPFVSGQKYPNEETVAAMKSSQNADHLTSFDSVDDMFASWDVDR